MQKVKRKNEYMKIFIGYFPCQNIVELFKMLLKLERVFVNAKGLGSTVLVGLLNVAYSQARSGYCPTRRLLPAAFPPWAGSSLLRQPGHVRLPQ